MAAHTVTNTVKQGPKQGVHSPPYVALQQPLSLQRVVKHDASVSRYVKHRLQSPAFNATTNGITCNNTAASSSLLPATYITRRVDQAVQSTDDVLVESKYPL